MFIAEIGLNHKGNQSRALKMLADLVTTNIDAITFQIPEPSFYKKSHEWGGALSNEFYKNAIEFAHKNNKLIGFAIKDKEMVSFLNKAGADFYKTLSSSILDNILLGQLQKTKKPLFISTGLSDEKEVIRVGKKLKGVTFIHTQLSHNLEDANVKAIERLRKVTKKKVAFGLHCANHQALYLAMAFEPSDVFFYVKDNSTEKFPDDQHSVIIENVNKVVATANEFKKAVGTGIKKKTKNRIK